jgi:hypothetical protein
MSRSRRHIKIFPTTMGDTEKKDKQIAHRAERAKLREVLSLVTSGVEADVDFSRYEANWNDNYNWSKDGKGYDADLYDDDLMKAMRK